jgi:hypothetical protein
MCVGRFGDVVTRDVGHHALAERDAVHLGALQDIEVAALRAESFDDLFQREACIRWLRGSQIVPRLRGRSRWAFVIVDQRSVKRWCGSANSSVRGCGTDISAPLKTEKGRRRNCLRPSRHVCD